MGSSGGFGGPSRSALGLASGLANGLLGAAGAGLANSLSAMSGLVGQNAPGQLGGGLGQGMNALQGSMQAQAQTNNGVGQPAIYPWMRKVHVGQSKSSKCKRKLFFNRDESRLK